MKINTDVGNSVRAAETAAAKTQPVQATQGAKATEAVGSVRISDATRSLQASGASNADAPFDAKRVDAIKAAISAGTFRVNPDAVAGKLIDSVSQLLTDKA